MSQFEVMIVQDEYMGNEFGAETKSNNLEVTLFYAALWCMLCLLTIDIISFYKIYNTNKDVQIIKGTIAAVVQITNGAVYVTHQFFYPKDLKGDVLDEKEKLSRTHDDFIHVTNSVGSHFYFGIDL